MLQLPALETQVTAVAAAMATAVVHVHTSLVVVGTLAHDAVPVLGVADVKARVRKNPRGVDSTN